MATEENLLRSMGFPYEVSRKAVNFYVTHANRLVDLCPRRLELIAKAFAADQPPAALEAELNSMAPTIIRPKLRLPASWVTVPDGVLLWPEQPFSKTKPPVEGEPLRRIRKREREYKRLHEPNQSEARTPAATPDPDPETPPPVAMQPVQPDPEPDPEPGPDPTPSIPDPEPMPTLRPIPGERRENPFDAINEVYRLPIETTCQMVADVLRQYPLDQWDKDDFDRLGEGLEGRADWQQCIAIAEAFVMFDHYELAQGVLHRSRGRAGIPRRVPGNLFVGVNRTAHRPRRGGGKGKTRPAAAGTGNPRHPNQTTAAAAQAEGDEGVDRSALYIELHTQDGGGTKGARLHPHHGKR